MIDDKLKKELHNIALKNRVSDTMAEIIVLTPFLFQKRKVEQEEPDKARRFYHKYLGNFFVKLTVLKKIRENEARKRKEQD